MTLVDGLVAYWPLDEQSDGSAPVQRNDAHTGGYHLTDANNVVSGIGTVYATAAQFVRSDSPTRKLRHAIAPFQTNNGAFTVAAWFNLASVAPASPLYSYIVAAHANDWTGGWSLFVSGQTVVLYVSHANGSNSVSHAGGDGGGGAWSYGTWMLGFGWYDPDTDKNSAQLCITSMSTVDEVSDTTGAANYNETYLAIGSRNDDTKQWDGLIGPVAFWNRVLLQEEREAFWNAGAGLTYSGFSSSIIRQANAHFARMRQQ